MPHHPYVSASGLPLVVRSALVQCDGVLVIFSDVLFRLLEEGQVENAQNEKERVEQLQRDTRAERQARGEEWAPRFFRYMHD